MSATSDEVRRVFGDISDHMVTEILATGATRSDLQVVAAYRAQETDVMGELERPLTGRAAQVHDILRSVDEIWEQDRDG
jgi:hypothetical protein